MNLCIRNVTYRNHTVDRLGGVGLGGIVIISGVGIPSSFVGNAYIRD